VDLVLSTFTTVGTLDPTRSWKEIGSTNKQTGNYDGKKKRRNEITVAWAKASLIFGMSLVGHQPSAIRHFEVTSQLNRFMVKKMAFWCFTMVCHESILMAVSVKTLLL